MVYADHCLAQLRDKNAQGVIFWDLEGHERPHAISYVGDPRKLAEVAPEMDRFADGFLKKFRDAGFRTGLTIRPTEYYDAAPGKHAWNQRDVKDPVALMSEKIRYARDRGGMTIFYLDSNVFSGGENVPWIMPTAMIRELQEEYPDCLIIPEWSAPDYYRWSAPYSSPNIGQLTTNVRDRFARVKWANAFGVVAVESSLLETQLGNTWTGSRAGMCCCSVFGKPEVARDRDMLEAVLHGLGRMRVTGALPGLLPMLAKDEGREREWVRVGAIGALGDLGDRRAIGPLLEEYKHGYSNVEVYVFRRYLHEALTKLTGQQHAVWPDHEGWKKWLGEQQDGNHSRADRK
jgi:hypothetical protein